MPRLVDQIREALSGFAGCRTPPALIGGLALAAHRVVRATQDVDFLIEAEDAERVHAMLIDLGYACIHRSDDAANYRRGDEGLDLLYARRPAARRLLADAEVRDTPMGRLHVISAEGLIGFKLQGYVNNPRRTRDMDDIRNLLSANRENLDLAEVRQYFELFGKAELLDALLKERDDDAVP